MRTRYRNYASYGMTREEARKIISICRAPEFKYRNIVEAAAVKSNAQIAVYLVRNICDREYWVNSDVYLDEDCFYGWRKKCLYFLKQEFEKLGIL